MYGGIIMNKEKKLIYGIGVLAVLCLVLLGILLIRKESVVLKAGNGSTITYSVDEAEKMTDMLARSSRSFYTDELFGGKKLSVIGHMCPDLDTVGSAIAYAKFLTELGFDAEPRITMAPNAQTRFALSYCDIPTPEILSDAAGKDIVLVDISDDVNSVKNITEANVVGIVDHHAHNLDTSRPILLEVDPSGATATIVGMSYLRNGLVPDEQTAKLLALTIISDTDGLTGSSVTEADRVIFDWTAEIGKINAEEVTKKLQEAELDYTGMTDTEIYYSDYKLYKAGDDEFRYMIGIGLARDREEMKDLALRLQDVINREYKESGLDMMLAQVYVPGDNGQYYVVTGQDADYIFQGAVGDLVTWDEETGLYYSEENMSRKTVVSPRINEFVLGEPR